MWGTVREANPINTMDTILLVIGPSRKKKNKKKPNITVIIVLMIKNIIILSFSVFNSLTVSWKFLMLWKKQK